MDSHFEIYENSAFSYADAEESLLVKPTPPPYKQSYNHIVSRRNTAWCGYIGVTTWQIDGPVRNAFFVRIYFN